jgi:hypothetical protein
MKSSTEYDSLGVFIKFEKYSKTKNLRILGFAGFTTFILVFEKIEKVTFLLLLPFFVGRAGFEPAKFTQQIYSLPSLAA